MHNNNRLILTATAFFLFFLTINTLMGCSSNRFPPASVLESGEITLSWEPLPDAVSYDVYLSDFPGVTIFNSHKIPVFNDSVSIIKLKPGVTYHILVIALLESGESRRSKEMAFTATEKGEAIHFDALFPEDGAEADIGRKDSADDKTADKTIVNDDLVICFGDSLTYGTGAIPGMDYPSQLGKMIDKQVINKGVPGDTTASARRRLVRDVLSQNPGWVLITLGGNDLKNGVSKKVAFYNLDVIVDAIQDNGATVIIGGLKFPGMDRGFGAGYEEVATQTGATLIADLLSGIFDNASLMSDPIHPNGKGYRLIAERFKKALLGQ